MNHSEKITWMHDYAKRHEVTLDLKGKCGLGRECVGILCGNSYPDYQWYDDDYDPQVPELGFVPEDAYHKHPCVAVLGRGESAESQLYDWLKWFDDNGYVVETVKNDTSTMDPIDLMLGRTESHRMVKK